MPIPPSRPLRRPLAAAAAAGALLMVSGCAGVAEPIPAYQDGWSAVHGQADNANAVAVRAPREPERLWQRNLGAPPSGNAAAGPDGQLIVSARTDVGCRTFALDLDNGRRLWCGWQNIGPGTMSPLVDQLAGVYTGNIGSADAFDVYGQLRWHTPVIGTPQPLQFLRDRAVLAVTHLGQVNVLSTTTGRKLAASVNLAPADWPPPPDTGLNQCAEAGPGCPVAFAPAVDTGADDFYLTFRSPGPDGDARLVSMHYEAGPSHRADARRSTPGEDADGRITERWRSAPLPGGAASAPALSPDGETVYVLSGDRTLWALRAADGTARWSLPLDFTPGRTVTVTGDGTIVLAPPVAAADGGAAADAPTAAADASGAASGAVVAVHDDPDAGRIAWRRPALHAGGPVSAADDGLGYVVTGPGAGADGPMRLTVLDLGDGSTEATADLGEGNGPGGTVTITGDGHVAVIGSAGLVSVLH